MVFYAWRVDQKLDHAPLYTHLSYHVFFRLASDETFFDARGFAALNFSWGAERRCGSVSDPHRRAAGWVGAMWRSFSPTRATIPPPRRNRMNTGFRATTAARRTSPARGAIIAAETKASRGCWRNDPRSGAGAKPKTERRTGAEIAEIRSDSVSSRQNRWAAMRRRASG